MSDAKKSTAGRVLLIAIPCVAVLAAGGYYAAAALFPSVERDLRSGDSARVVGALAKVDNESFTSEENEALRANALETLKNAPVDDVFERMWDAEVTPEERQRMEENMRALMMEDMRRKIDEYENAPESEKDAILDRHIDEMREFGEKMRAFHEKHKDDPEYQKRMEEQRGDRRGPSIEQRKSWMEGTNPDSMMRMWKYFGKMRQRANARGVEFGPGRRGGND